MNRRLQHESVHDALADLSQLQEAPDLTRSIMGRLGYMRVNRHASRRRATIRWFNRAGLVMVAAIAFSIGWRVFQSSPQVRRPAQTTIPQAIRHDVERQQQRLGTMLETVRTIATLKLDKGSQPTAPGERIPDDGPQTTPDDVNWPQELRDDVNRTPGAPVRWV